MIVNILKGTLRQPPEVIDPSTWSLTSGIIGHKKSPVAETH